MIVICHFLQGRIEELEEELEAERAMRGKVWILSIFLLYLSINRWTGGIAVKD